jgi:hypothetical protein
MPISVSLLRITHGGPCAKLSPVSSVPLARTLTLTLTPCREDIKCVLPDVQTRDEGEGPPFVCVRGGAGDECGAAQRFAAAV